MTLRNTAQQTDLDTAWPYVGDMVAPRSKPRKSRPKARRNYRAANRPGTDLKQAAILRLLALAPVGFSVRDVGDALGISRQLALYHVKKLAAQGALTMILEPCPVNGGLQFLVWDTRALVRAFAAQAQQVAA